MGLTSLTSQILGPRVNGGTQAKKDTEKQALSLTGSVFSLFSPCTDGAASLSGLQVHILSSAGPSTGLRYLARRAAFI